MNNVELYPAQVTGTEIAKISWPLSKNYLRETLDVTDGNLVIQLGQNFRRSLEKWLRRILEQQISKSGKDPALFAEATADDSRILAFSFMQRLIGSLNGDFQNNLRTEYAAVAEERVLEHLQLELPKFVSEFVCD